MSSRQIPFQAQITFWVVVAIFASLIVWMFKAMLFPFVLGVAVAYLLNPVVNKLGELDIARAPAALMILGGFLIFMLGFIALIAPI